MSVSCTTKTLRFGDYNDFSTYNKVSLQGVQLWCCKIPWNYDVVYTDYSTGQRVMLKDFRGVKCYAVAYGFNGLLLLSRKELNTLYCLQGGGDIEDYVSEHSDDIGGVDWFRITGRGNVSYLTKQVPKEIVGFIPRSYPAGRSPINQGVGTGDGDYIICPVIGEEIKTKRAFVAKGNSMRFLDCEKLHKAPDSIYSPNGIVTVLRTVSAFSELQEHKLYRLTLKEGVKYQGASTLNVYVRRVDNRTGIVYLSTFDGTDLTINTGYGYATVTYSAIFRGVDIIKAEEIIEAPVSKGYSERFLQAHKAIIQGVNRGMSDENVAVMTFQVLDLYIANYIQNVCGIKFEPYVFTKSNVKRGMGFEFHTDYINHRLVIKMDDCYPLQLKDLTNTELCAKRKVAFIAMQEELQSKLTNAGVKTDFHASASTRFGYDGLYIRIKWLIEVNWQQLTQFVAVLNNLAYME